jgi:hypothetical protein
LGSVAIKAARSRFSALSLHASARWITFGRSRIRGQTTVRLRRFIAAPLKIISSACAPGLTFSSAATVKKGTLFYNGAERQLVAPNLSDRGSQRLDDEI